MADLTIKVVLEGGQFRAETGQIEDAVTTLEGTVTASLDSMVARVAGFSIAFNQIKTFAQDVAAFVERPIEVFSRLETSMANVESLGVPNIKSLSSSVLDLAEDTAVPLDSLSAGLYDVVSAGVDADNQISFLALSAQAAKAGVASATDSIALSSAVIKGYGKEWSDANTILDQAFKTIELGQTNFPALASNIGGLTSGFSALKLETFELFGALATLTGVTGNTNEVTTQLRAITTELARPTAELTELVRAQGFATVEQLTAQRGLAGVLETVRDATGGSAAKMNEFFSSSEAVTALLSLTTSQYQTFIEKSEEIATSQGAMTAAFEVQSATIESQVQLIENKLNVKMIETVEVIRPVIGTILEYAVSLLEVDYEPFIIGAATAGAAVVGLNIGIAITALGGLSGALAVAGTAFTTFSTVATAAITSIPIAGWIAAGVSALGVLSVALIATADDEEDLAIQRRTVAEETINIINAEIDRVEQAIKTQGATKDLTDQLENMNQNLINQQKIIADANISIFTADLNEATDAVNDFAQEWGAAGFAVSDGVDPVIDKMREFRATFGDDFVGLQAEVSSQLAEVIGTLRLSQAGAIEISDERIAKLQEEREALIQINEVVSQASEAQGKLNSEVERLDRLGEIEVEIKTNVDPDDADPLGLGSVEVPVRPVVDFFPDEITIPVKVDVENPEDLAFFDDDAFVDQLDHQLSLLELQRDNMILTDEQYFEDKIALLAESAEEVAASLGTESELYLQINAERLDAEKDFQDSRVNIAQTATLAIISNMSALMTAAQGSNKTLFELGKAASIAQASIDTIAGATRAFKDFPLPVAIPVAATVTALGIANVAKIASTEFQSKAEGGLIGDENRTVSKGDFGNGENRLIIANDGEFIMNAGQTNKNLSLFEYINSSDRKFDLIGDGVITVSSLPNRIDGGLINQINNTNAGISQIVSSSENRTENSAINLQQQFDQFREDVVQAINNLDIIIRGTMDGQEFLKENLEQAEKKIRERRAV